ncbi:MAG: response regulator transcription factor [Clostridia bacterium]|nr:response regulator transcription factor [Clostridia bacterium]
MLRILICVGGEDLAVRLKNDIEKHMRIAGVGVRIDAVCSPGDVPAAPEKYDLAFLGIEPDGIDGLALARTIGERNGRTLLFFVADSSASLDGAMDARAFRFFEKPVDPDRLRAGLDRTLEYLDRVGVFLYLTNAGETVRIAAEEILFVERENRRVFVRTKTGRFCASESFASVCGRLPQTQFFLIHRSFFINLRHVEACRYAEVRMDDGARLSVASRRQAAFRRRWSAFLREGRCREDVKS